MNKLLEQIAYDKGLSTDDVVDIVANLSTLIVNRVPEFRPVIQDVFLDADAEILYHHITEMVSSLKEKETVSETWSMPYPSYLFKQNENDPLF